MKHIFPILLLMLACTACTQTPFAPSATETYHYADSTAFVNVRIDAEMPAGTTPAQKEMREELAAELTDQVLLITEDDFVTLTDEENQPEALTEALGRRVLGRFMRMAQRDADERTAYILANQEYSAEEKETMLAHMPVWQGIVNIRRIDENAHYTVYLSENYVYMGGAHGGVSGAGYLTFETATGYLFTQFLKEEAEDRLQPALRKGLKGYFAENETGLNEEQLEKMLFIKAGWIPLPEQLPYPTAEGLVFTYQQYEIAPYAMGMPSFTLPYDVLMPYLTSDAVKLLDLKR